MGCCQSGRHGGAQASHSHDGSGTGGGGAQSVTTGNRSASPSNAAALSLGGSNRRNDPTSLEEIRRSYLQGSLKVDDACPLTDRQLYGLTKSWKAINRNMGVTAINMFVRLFETNSDIKTMFAKLRDFETVAELRSSKIFEEHAMKVICTIDDAIVNLDDMQYVTRMLQTVAQSHSSRFPNFNPDFFARVEEPFILAVKEELGDRFTISVETIYRTTIRYILSTLTTEFRQHRVQQQQSQQQDSVGQPNSVAVDY